MPLASEIVNAALTHIQVKTAGVPPTDDENADAVEALNDMLTEWASGGLHLGYQVVDEVTDETDLGAHTLAAIKYELAARLAPSYGKTVSAAFVEMGFRSKATLVQAAVEIPEVLFPSTLPVGSGNTSHGHHTRRYFPDTSANDITNESGSSLLTDEGLTLDVEE